MLEFEPKHHVYTLDGIEIPSVSHLTRFLAREVYGDCDPIILERAADKGTRVHKACEMLDKEGVVECYEDIAGYIKAYADFRSTYNEPFLKIEEPFYKETEYGTYAGTIDRAWSNSIIDIKTTKSISKLHKIIYTAQLSLYANGVNPEANLYILQLKEDGTYKIIPIEYNEELVTMCLKLNQMFTKTKRKKKEVIANG